MKKYDLVVVGGGISGIAAAVSSAREGLSVLVVEKFGSLGGAMSNSLVYPYSGASMYSKNKRVIADKIFHEMVDRKEKYNDTSWEAYKLVFDDMLMESGVDVLFHSTVFEAITEDRKIKSVKIATKSGVISVEADYFIDASGDGELIYMTGCDYQLGRESDGLSQPMTTCFRMSNVDIDLFLKEKDVLQEKYENLQKENKIINPRENILFFLGFGAGIVHFNTTRIVKHNPVDPFELSKAEITARKQVYEMADFLKENSDAFKNSTVVSIASHIGVRESRKLKGVYILTEKDVTEFLDFEDTVALGNYGIDIHNPSGTGTIQFHLNPGEFYRIPYRCLLPKEYDNMLVAGRCLSATHVAHSAVRVMPICACVGEAAGTAIAVAQKANTTTHDIDIKTLQNKLREDGALI
ncbi:MAG: FAD-dependent oxidoreductase [Clostridia bacterium]|nr:FAD-dependent oxidoreductase [Clostridia bacterium]